MRKTCAVNWSNQVHLASHLATLAPFRSSPFYKATRDSLNWNWHRNRFGNARQVHSQVITSIRAIEGAWAWAYFAFCVLRSFLVASNVNVQSPRGQRRDISLFSLIRGDSRPRSPPRSDRPAFTKTPDRSQNSLDRPFQGGSSEAGKTGRDLEISVKCWGNVTHRIRNTRERRRRVGACACERGGGELELARAREREAPVSVRVRVNGEGGRGRGKP